MSDQINVKEIDGRIQMLQLQRDQALNQNVVLAGQLAALTEKLEKAEAEVKRLTPPVPEVSQQS